MSIVVRKPPLAVRISVTDRCQLRCVYCMPEEGIQCRAKEDIISFENIIKIIEHLQAAFYLEKVRLTGGEPLLRKNIVELIRMLKQQQIPDIALTTNGQLLKDMAEDLYNAGLQRINISLDTIDAEHYYQLTRGGDVSNVIAGINSAINAGFTPIKINSVVFNETKQEEIFKLIDFAIKNGCQQRFLEIMPIGHGVTTHNSGFVSCNVLKNIIRTRYTLQKTGRSDGSSAIQYQVTDDAGNSGIIGFIAPCTIPFCSDCRRLRITPDGMLIGCLALSKGVEIGSSIDNRELFLKKVNNVLGEKRTDNIFKQAKNMATIGG